MQDGTSEEYLTQKLPGALHTFISDAVETIEDAGGYNNRADHANKKGESLKEGQDRKTKKCFKTKKTQSRTRGDWINTKHFSGGLPGELQIKIGSIVTVVGCHLENTLKGTPGVASHIDSHTIWVYFFDNKYEDGPTPVHRHRCTHHMGTICAENSTGKHFPCTRALRRPSTYKRAGHAIQLY